MDLPRIVALDHNYARRDAHGCYLKPTKTLFPNKVYNQSSDHIDVTTCPYSPPTEYDPVKALQLMEECERFVIFAGNPRTEDCPVEDWENIRKDGWTQDQGWLFKKVCDILHEDRLARLALKGCWSEPAKRRAHVDGAAQRFRNAMATIAWDVRLTQWLHALLVDNLDMGYLAAYVDILQTLKVRIPTLVDRLLAGAVYGKTPIVQQGLNLLLKRPWDPAVSALNAKKKNKLAGNPIILLVPSSLKRQQMTPRCSLWSSNLSSLAELVTVTATPGTITPKMTVQAYLEQMVSATKCHLASLRREHPDRPIVLIGWRSGAAVALQVATSDTVAAVVTLGFPTRTVEGRRGDPDDLIYNLTCPVLFVTGENANTARPEDLEEIRSKLLSLTWLVVVGHSDDCLRMFRRHRIAMGMTQSLVDRAVLEAVGEFLSESLLNYNSSRPPTPVLPTSGVIGNPRMSTDSSMDSEGSHKRHNYEPLAKMMKTSGTDASKENGVTSPPPYTPAKRGRKKGSLNKFHKVKISPKKTLQTLSPVSRPLQVKPLASGEDVTLDVGTPGSLGIITKTVSPQSQAVRVSSLNGSTATEGLQGSGSGAATFRIQAGRLSVGPGVVAAPAASDTTFATAGNIRLQPAIATATPTATFRIQASRMAASSAPPSEVMPIRPSEATVFSALNNSLKGHAAPTAVWKTSVSRPGGMQPRLSSTNRATSVSPVKTFNVSRLPFNSQTKMRPKQPNNSMIRVASPRQFSSTNSGTSFKVGGTGVRMAKPQVTSMMKASSTTTASVGRFVMAKRLSVGGSTVVQQKPLIVTNRAATEEVDHSSFTLVHDNITEMYLESEEEKHRPVMTANPNRTEQVGEPMKQSALVLKERPKQHVVLTSGEPYVVSQLSQGRSSLVDRRVSGEEVRKGSTYIVNFPKKTQETMIYEIVDTMED